jgi:hypothetical protein
VNAPLPGSLVKAISLWEPWASLMRTGAKAIETRHWQTSYRGWLLICASRRCVGRDLRVLLADPDFQRGLAPLASAWGAQVGLPELAFGHAIALVELYACVPTTARAGSCEHLVTADELAFGDFSQGRFAWFTRDRRLFPPFPVVGHQGFFDVRLPAGLSLTRA